MDLSQSQVLRRYFDIISKALNEKRRAKLINDLKEYYKLDSLEMVKIVRKLVKEQ